MLIVIVFTLVTLAVFWMPFLLKTGSFWGIDFGHHGMETIVANFDGLNYIAVAKTMYDPTMLATKFAGFDNPPIYYAAHFPVYPLLIASLDAFNSGPQALLLATIISNIVLAIALLYFFETVIKDKNLAMTLALVALVFPGRMLSLRGVGSSEPLFIAFVLTSLALCYKGKHIWAAILGSLAVLTRSPGIFLFGAYMLSAIVSYKSEGNKLISKSLPYLMMPMALGLLFAFYGYRYGNFWAYFNNSSELHPIFFPPFMIFSNSAKWISDMWREDILYMYLIYGTGIALYIKQIKQKCGLEKLAIGAYAVVYGLILLLVSHRDLARYGLPIAPIAILGFAPYLTTKNLKWLLVFLIPIYLLAWQFVVANVQMVSDWGPLL